MGAWIETVLPTSRNLICKSHPTWVRGLKLPLRDDVMRILRVAPYVGAWIETMMPPPSRAHRMSHPTWVRGLKHRWGIFVLFFDLSHPTWVRGLKLENQRYHARRLRRTLRGCVD